MQKTKSIRQAGSIKKELEDCRAAFAAHPNTPFAWCIHHEQELEPITESIENRIEFILKYKAEDEQAIRFRNLRPARNLPAELVKVGEDYCEASEAHEKALEAHWKASEARAKAWVAYDKAKEAYEKAREAYDKAYEAYEKAREACEKTYAAYDKAGEAYWKAREAYCKTCEAYLKAYEPYKAQFSELHTRDWPDHTWSGKSIF